MDRDARLRLLPASDDDEGEIRNVGILSILLLPLIILMICFMPYAGFVTLGSKGRLKFSMEPVAYTGLGLAADEDSPAAPPSFNVTLRAKSTYGRVKFCSSGQTRMEVTYSGVPIAVTDVESFCVDARGGEVVITAAVSSGWPVLPDVFKERMESDRRQGGVQIQVDFSFTNKDHAEPYKELTWWVRCPAMLNTDQTASSCTSYVVSGCYCT